MFNHQQNCALAATLIDRMAGMLRGADLSTPVPTCPGWDLSRLVTHLGGIHRWAVQLVESRAQERVAPAKGERGPDLVEWLAAGAIPVAGLAAAPAADRMWAWGKEQSVGFWSRRLVHETAIHYADAAIAVGAPVEIESDIAADGVDELLDNLPFATWNEKIAQLRGSGSLHFHGNSDGAEWMIELNDSGYSWHHGHAKGSVAVRGTTVDLYLLLYRRLGLGDAGAEGARFEVFGEREVVEHWLECAGV